MDKIRFVAKEDTIYDATLRYISEHVMGIKLTQTLVKDLYTSGFDLINENNGSVMASYRDYTTEYRLMDDGEIQLSNDGSTYVPPEPPAPVIVEVTAKAIWEDNDDEDKIRPTSVNVVFYVEGTKAGSKKLNKNNNWQHVFEVESDKSYELVFDEVVGYTKDGMETVVYTHKPLSSVKKEKIKAMRSDSTAIIHNGAKVALSTDETIHFNFSDYVQVNLGVAYSTAKSLIELGERNTLVPFYTARNKWDKYAAVDIVNIYLTMDETIMNNANLFHQLQDQINNMEDEEAVKTIEFTPESLDAGHKDIYDEMVESVQNVINTIKGRLGVGSND